VKENCTAVRILERRDACDESRGTVGLLKKKGILKKLSREASQRFGQSGVGHSGAFGKDPQLHFEGTGGIRHAEGGMKKRKTIRERSPLRRQAKPGVKNKVKGNLQEDRDRVGIQVW